jgi:hypothetical protein
MGVEGEALLPPNAKAGECHARVFSPPTYKSISETALKKEASEKLIVQEPKFEMVDEQVMTKAPSERWETVPATYEWIEDTNLSELEKVSAGKSLSDPENTRLGNASAAKLEIIPATYEWAKEQVLAYPEHVHYEQVPAVYETVKEKVIDQQQAKLCVLSKCLLRIRRLPNGFLSRLRPHVKLQIRQNTLQ